MLNEIVDFVVTHKVKLVMMWGAVSGVGIMYVATLFTFNLVNDNERKIKEMKEKRNEKH